MEQLNRLLLTLYTAAGDAGPDEFPQFAIALTQSMLDFDFARLTSIQVDDGHAIVSGSILYRDCPQMLLDWQAIAKADLVLARGLAQPRRALSFHAPTLFSGKDHAVMRDYADRYEHQTGTVILIPDAKPGAWDGLCFYRAHAARLFSARDKRLVDLVAPHIMQAMKINRMAAGAGAAADPALAFMAGNGQVQYAAPAFTALIRREWPHWPGGPLPAPLTAALARAPGASYCGRSVTISAAPHGQLLLLRAQAVSPLALLTKREMTAALLFGAGRSNKETARAMGISPNTSRNFIQQIYQKLQIGDKAALAVIIEQQGARAPSVAGRVHGH